MASSSSYKLLIYALVPSTLKMMLRFQISGICNFVKTVESDKMCMPHNHRSQFFKVCGSTELTEPGLLPGICKRLHHQVKYKFQWGHLEKKLFIFQTCAMEMSLKENPS